MGLYQMPRPVTPIQGPSVQQTYVFQPNQPELSRFKALNTPRYTTTIPLRAEGAAAVVQTQQIHTPNQPDQARYFLTNALRFQVDVTKQLDNTVVGPVAQSFLFAIGQPQFRLTIQAPRPRPPLDIAASIVVQTDVFHLSQPEPSYYKFDANRTPDRSRTPVDGPTRQQTYVFVPNQPDRAAYYKFDPNRLPPSAPPRTEGVFVPPLFEVAWALYANAVITPSGDGPITH